MVIYDVAAQSLVRLHQFRSCSLGGQGRYLHAGIRQAAATRKSREDAVIFTAKKPGELSARRWRKPV